MDWSSRATVLLKDAELLAGKYRHTINAATMLNMSTTCHQAEIDSACELIDFWRFNPYFMAQVYDDQPLPTQHVLNYMEHRPLEGFVFAISPFNFASIAGNLPTSPALMGNAVVWKPASSAVLPAYYIMKILQEAGMPDGVINMVPGPGPVRSDRRCSTTSTSAASNSPARRTPVSGGTEQALGGMDTALGYYMMLQALRGGA